MGSPSMGFMIKFSLFAHALLSPYSARMASNMARFSAPFGGLRPAKVCTLPRLARFCRSDPRGESLSLACALALPLAPRSESFDLGDADDPDASVPAAFIGDPAAFIGEADPAAFIGDVAFAPFFDVAFTPFFAEAAFGDATFMGDATLGAATFAAAASGVRTEDKGDPTLAAASGLRTEDKGDATLAAGSGLNKPPQLLAGEATFLVGSGLRIKGKVPSRDKVPLEDAFFFGGGDSSALDAAFCGVGDSFCGVGDSSGPDAASLVG